MKKIKMVVMIALLAVTSAIYFFRQQSTQNNEHYFVVGTAAGYAPFASVNQSGQYEGFDIDVARALADQMGKTLVIKDLGSMTSLFMALDQGMIDAIIWGISITQERLEKVAMIHYQGAAQLTQPLIFWNTIPENIKTLDDIKDATVCVEPGSSHAAVLAKYPNIRTISIEKVDDALLHIQYGKADAAFVEPAIAQKFKNKYPEIKIIDVPLPISDQVHGVGIVVKKNRQVYIDKIVQAIAVLKTSGTIEQSAQQWNIPS